MKRSGRGHGSVFIRDFHVAPGSGDLARLPWRSFTVAGQRRIPTGFADPRAPVYCDEPGHLSLFCQERSAGVVRVDSEDDIDRRDLTAAENIDLDKVAGAIRPNLSDQITPTENRDSVHRDHHIADTQVSG